MREIVRIAAAFFAVSALDLTAVAAGPRVTILGDSYSTFAGCMPSGYETYYTGSNCGVSSSSQTWWHQVIVALGGTLAVNNSWSGSLICTKTHGSTKPFVHADRLANLGSPDLILVFGGTNDAWDQAPVGDDVLNPYLPASWTAENLAKLVPAYAYLIDRLQTLHPSAEIMMIVNSTNDTQATAYGSHRVGISSMYATAMADVAAHYGLTCVQLHDISKVSEHPDAAGMTAIANQVVAAYRADHPDETVAPLRISGPTQPVPVKTDEGLVYVFDDASADYTVTVTNATTLVKALIVGGGGAGGWTIGGGGGGGQVLAPTGIGCDMNSGMIFTIHIGAGGAGYNGATSAKASPWPYGGNGGSTTLDIDPEHRWTAEGGGGGGGFACQGGDDAAWQNGRSGACGGGGAYQGTGGGGTSGGAGGTTGGSGYNRGGGGGGGASGSDGGAGTASASGAGGAGVTSAITGTLLDYGSGGGGGGGNTCAAGAAGGAGAGAGSAANSNQTGAPGLDGRGGGGGGGCFTVSANTGYAGGVGGCGCVILCFSDAAASMPDFSALALVDTARDARVVLKDLAIGSGATCVTAHFACARDAAALETTAMRALGPGGVWTNELAGLVAGATYHYRFAVTNDLTPACGRIVTGRFTLPAEDLGDVYPADITLVESISSSGGAYILTGVGARRNMSVSGRFRFDGVYVSGRYPVFGAEPQGFLLSGAESSGRLGFDSPETVTGPKLVSGTVYSFSTEGHALTVDGTTYPSVADPGTWYENDDTYMPLFASFYHTSGASCFYTAPVTVYGFRIAVDGVLQRDYVPARDGSGKACLFDRINHQYCHNDASTGTLTANGTAVDDVSEITVTQAELRGGVLTAVLTRTNPVKALDLDCCFGSYCGTDAAAWAAAGGCVRLATGFAAGMSVIEVRVEGLGDTLRYARFRTSDRVWSPSLYLPDIRQDGPYEPPVGEPPAFALVSSETSGVSSVDFAIDVTALGTKRGSLISCPSAGCYFLWGLSPDLLHVRSVAGAVGGLGPCVVTATGVNPGTEVYGRLVMTNAAGTAQSEVVRFRMPADTRESPTALRGITVSRFRGREVTLTFGSAPAGLPDPAALYVAWGPASSDDGTNGYAHLEKIADVPSAQTTFAWCLPDRWGHAADCRVARFFLMVSEQGPYDYPSYVESTGTQYVRTGVYPASDVAVEGRVSVSSEELNRDNHWWTVFGHFTGTTDGFCVWSEKQRNFQLTFNRPSICQFGPNLKDTPDTPVDFSMTGTSVTVNGTAYTHTGTYNCTTTGAELPLFAFYSGGTYLTRESHVRVHAFRLRKAGVLVRDYVPVRVRSTGCHTLLDRVSGDLATVSFTSGSADFAPGPYTNAVPGGVISDASRTLYADPRPAGMAYCVR